MNHHIILMLSIALIVALVAACTEKLPDAMHYETVKQRAVAAKDYQHHEGLPEYQQFTANNK